MTDAERDQNHVTVTLGVSSDDNVTTLPIKIDPITGRLIVDIATNPGTVTTVSVATANGFSGTVATATTTPVITISTTVTGLLKGNGTAISAAIANTDYQSPINLTTTGSSGAATFNGTTLNIPQYVATGDVVGPASATDNAIARFDTTTGKLIQNSTVTIADTTGVIAGTQGVTISGATSGTLLIKSAAVSGTNTITFPAGTTDFSATGGTSRVLMQTSAGAAITVDQLAASNLSNGTTGSGSVVLATSPTLVTPVLGTPSSGTLTSCTGLPIVGGTTGTLSLARGGTGLTSIAALSIWVANSANTLVAVTPTAGQSIRVNAGGTAWEAYTPSAGASGITIGTTTITSGTTTRILYNNAGVVGEYTLTGSGTVVAMQTAPTFVTSITTPSVLATANDSGALGASGTAFSDLFLASGAVINFAAGNSVITHSSAVLEVTTGDLRVTTAGTNSASVVTVGGTQTLTNKTLTSPRIGTNILDTNGNELFVLTATASAVNDVTFANAATGANPTFTASGGDSNIGFDFLMKGTGTFNLKGNSTQAAELRLYEDTDAGTNYSAFKVGTQAGNLTYTLPTALGSAGAVLTDAAGNGVLSWASGGGSANPGWDFVSYTTASAAADITVSSLDLVTDICYRVILEITESGSNEASTPYVRINGITTSTYDYMVSYAIFGSGGISTSWTSGGANGTRAYLIATGNPHSFSSEFSFNMLGVSAGTKRVVGRHTSTGVSNSGDEVQTCIGSFKETSQTNMTSITFGDLTSTKDWKVWVFKSAQS